MQIKYRFNVFYLLLCFSILKIIQMEKKCNIYDVLYCYYENNKKTYKEIPMWRYTEDDARKDCIRRCKEEYGCLFVEIVRIKQIM